LSRVRQEEWLRFVKIFLQHCRDLVNTYDRSNLPRWLQSANIRYGVINDSLIAIFDDGDKGDTHSYLGNIDSDVVAIFKFENFIPFSTGINIPNNRGLVIFEGEVASNGGAVMQLRDEYPLFFDCGHHGRHVPMILCNLFFQYMPPSHSKSGPKSTQFIAFALYVHKSHIVDSTFLSTCDEQLIPHFTRTNLTLGPYYKKRQEIRQVFSVTVESTVIVLGKDSNETILNQMGELKVALSSKGYQAVLVKELSEIPEWSNEQKVRAWAAAARFCVMIDDEPSGHDA
jgi:hypothetical protein